jgi:hypothetical protein
MTTLKLLPARPSLESIRKQAKKLARDVAASNVDAVARIRAQLPNAQLPLSQRDAQLVLAREYGFAGWHLLREEVLKRMGKGLEWAAAQAERAIHDDDIERLQQLLAEYPALLSWRDEHGNVLLQATTAYAFDTSNPQREAEYNRPICAELLIDMGAAIQPSVWERVISSGAVGMLQLLRRKGVLPNTLPMFAALGDSDAVRACFDEAGALRATARGKDRNELAVVDEAFMYACRFKHNTIAAFLLDRCIALDAELGRRVDSWQGRAAFVEYLCRHAAPQFGGLNVDTVPLEPWRAFVARQLEQALDENDLSAFVRWLRSEPYLLGESCAGFQVYLIEQAAHRRDRGQFIANIFELNPSILKSRESPPSRAVEFAVAYGNAHLVPLLGRMWPLPDDLPHAAGVGDFARVKRWFDAAGQPALGNLNGHFPISNAEKHAGLGWGANNMQQILDTALAWACMNKQLEVAAFLLEHGADINTRWATHEPASILHECALCGNFEAVRFLIDRGIDVTIRCYRYDATARGWAYHAAKNFEMADLLAAAEERQQQRSG